MREEMVRVNEKISRIETLILQGLQLSSIANQVRWLPWLFPKANKTIAKPVLIWAKLYIIAGVVTSD
jgi:hypothetical protein